MRSHSSECGRYKVETRPGGKVLIWVRKSDSPYLVPQDFLAEDVNDLDNLFTAIGSVLAEIQNEQ